MSGSLPNRLVELGAEKIAARNERPWTHSDETQYRLEARDVIAAVLRELDRAVMERVASGSSDFIDLEALAGVVERGE